MAELQPDGVGTDLDSTDVVEEAHVPDGENRAEQAIRAVLWQYFIREGINKKKYVLVESFH